MKWCKNWTHCAISVSFPGRKLHYRSLYLRKNDLLQIKITNHSP